MYDKNLTLKLNIAGLYGAFGYEIQGRTGKKKCICIPEDNLYIGKDGAAYADIALYPTDKFGNVFSGKQSVKKEIYTSLSPEERKRLPYIASAKEFGGANTTGQTTQASAPIIGAVDGDLPF